MSGCATSRSSLFRSPPFSYLASLKTWTMGQEIIPKGKKGEFQIGSMKDEKCISRSSASQDETRHHCFFFINTWSIGWVQDLPLQNMFSTFSLFYLFPPCVYIWNLIIYSESSSITSTPSLDLHQNHHHGTLSLTHVCEFHERWAWSCNSHGSWNSPRLTNHFPQSLFQFHTQCMKHSSLGWNPRLYGSLPLWNTSMHSLDTL